MGKLLWIISLLALGTFGCDRDGSDSVTPAAVKVPDAEVRDEDGVSRYYNAANEYTARALEEAAAVYEVRSEKARFEELGYRYRADHSYVIEGDRSDGRHAEITVLAMENPDAPDADAVFLYFLEGRYRNFVVPTKMVRAETAPEGDYRQVGEDLWFGVIDPLRESAGAGGGAAWEAARFSWRQWATCVSEGLAAGLAACIGGCRFVPLSFGHCMAACGTTVFIGTVLNCTFQQL